MSSMWGFMQTLDNKIYLSTSLAYFLEVEIVDISKQLFDVSCIQAFGELCGYCQAFKPGAEDSRRGDFKKETRRVSSMSNLYCKLTDAE